MFRNLVAVLVFSILLQVPKLRAQERAQEGDNISMRSEFGASTEE